MMPAATHTTTARVAVFRSAAGRLLRSYLPAGLPVAVDIRPAPCWSVVTLPNGDTRLVATPNVRDFMTPR